MIYFLRIRLSRPLDPQREMRYLIFVLLATGAIAAPFISLEREKPPLCDTRYNRFHHLKEFPYNYEGETISRIAGASSARSGLKIRARCVVKSVAPCQHVLKLDTVELWEAQSKNPGPLKYHVSRGSTAFAEELEAQDLVFRTDRGRVTEILAHPEEPSHVLNIKRGILSALQVQFVDQNTTVVEDDVVGKCKVHYHIKSRHLSSRPKVIYKTRNLTECTDRVQTDIGIHVHSYEEKPISLLNSHSTCKLYLTAKTRTQKVVCEEEHIFRPFSAGYRNASGAITTTRQVLELQSIKHAEPETVSIAGRRSVSLKYAHAQPQSDQEGIRDAFYLISRLSQESQKSTRPDSAQHFMGIVYSIRKLNTPAMENLWQKVHQEEDQKMHEYFYDALPHCGTGGCAKVMSHAIRNNLVSHERGNIFLAGLAMAANPTKETVEHVLELCEENAGRTAMLTLGTLIHKVCESNPQQCDSKDRENPITKAEYFLKSRLGVRCEGNTPEEFENILITLKAIGNAGRPESAENIILKCAVNLDAPVNMSIAALEALRRLPCNKQMTEQLLEIYGEHDLDVEIRIAAYLALMKCPSPEVFRRIADILKNEVNNQVGSFVWSHMTNAMDSTEPVHGLPQAEMMKDALSGMTLREFNLNRLRFSRAWEGSFYSDVLRLGGSAQSHLIYHPTSFFPRSAMVNFTVDVLGASINVLETAARFEGVEILIEQFFGEEGYLPDDRIMKMFNLKPHEERDKEERTVNKVLREKRSLGLHDDINKVEKHLNLLHRTMDNRKHHPAGAVSVKMFGNELRLASFDDISWLNDEIDKVNVIDFLLMLAKGGKKSFSKSMMFLDAQTTVPTILGLPLNLCAKGTTVASVELAGKFDIRNMFWGKMSFDVRGYVKPSAVVDISGRMGVSAVHAEAGILVNSSLYTVTQIKGNATYSQSELLKFEIGVPEDPVQFVNVSSSLFTTLNDEKLAIEGTPRRIEPSPCLNLTRLLGLKFCGQLSVPLAYRDLNAPFFPFSGPASYSISMQRTDPTLTKYQVIAERLQTEDENRYDVITSISTPGAKWERNFDANVTLWIKEDGKLFTLSTGALGTNFGTFEATYNNVTHALNLTYSAKDAIYGYPIVLNGHFFNNTEETLSREIGIHMSASYRNYTIQQLTKLYNRSNVYGFVNNITYWPGKYLFATGELNIPENSIGFVANHTCTKTEIRFKGNLGDEENNFVFNFNNKPTDAGINLTGRLLKSRKEGVLRLFARPGQQSFTLRGFYAKSGNEQGIRFTASHDNKNRVVSWYTGIVNSTNEKALKANATVLGSKAEAVWSFFNFTQKKGVKFNGLLLNKTIDAAWLYVNAGQEKAVRFNATGFNKTMEAAWTFLNLTTGKSVKFNASVINRTIEAVWSYVNRGKEKGLLMNALAINYTMQSALVFQDVSDAKSIKLNATALNRSVEAAWSYVNAGKEKGIRFNITGFNRTAEVMWSYLNFGSQRRIHFNASVLNRTMEATWTFLNLTKEKGVKFQSRALNKTFDATWSFLNSASEKSIKFNARAFNKTFDAKWTFLNLTNEKGLKFQACTQNKSIDATWSILNSAIEKSMKLNVSAFNKTLNAKWSFLNFTNEKGVKFHASALNKTLDATWSFLNLGSEKSLRFNASSLNKTFDSKWSFVNVANEKSLKFDSRVLNKTINASWSFIDLGNEKSLLFKASVLNRTVNATWIVLNLKKEKRLLFKASFLNKTAETALSILNQRNEKGLKFMAKAQGKTIDATCTFVNLTNEKSLKFRASALNNSIESSWSVMNFPSEKGIKFNVSGLNKTLHAAWTFISLTNEKLIKFNVTGFNKGYTQAVLSYLRGENERSIKFNASAMKKTVEAVISYSRSEGESAIKVKASAMNTTMGAIWSYVKNNNERSVKFNASVMNKTVEAIWSYVMDENERGIAFNASAMNKSIGATWSYVKRENERSLKFKVSAVNKTAQVVFSCLMSENERAIVFNASAMNKTVGAVWSYVKDENGKSLKFKATAMNNTIEATWSYVKGKNGKSLKFKASAMNKTIETSWSYLKVENGKSLKFKAAAMKNSIESTFSFLKIENERALKFNASAMNKTLEAIWSYVEDENENVIKFNASVLKKTVEAVWSYVRHEDAKSFKFNASAMNKSIEATWTYLRSEDGRSMKFNASAMNKTVEATWSYLKTENGRSIWFRASAINKTVEAIWTLLNNNSKKGLQFNFAVMNRTMNSSLVYFTEPTSMGLRLNISCCNKSFVLETKMLYQEKQRKLVVSAAYQNYTVALVGLFQNVETQKSACLYPEYFGRSHGKICAIFTDSSAEKSMALNMSVLNQTGELKTQWFKNQVECATRLTAKFKRTTFLESWLSFFHTSEFKSLHFNATVIGKSVSASLYFRNMTEKALGFNATVLKRQIGVEGAWLNGNTVKEAAVRLFWNQIVIAKSAVIFLNTTKRQMVEFRSHIGRLAAEWQTTVITASEGVKELLIVRMLRNGSHSLFFDSSKVVLSREERSSSLTYQYNVRVMGRSYDYGWVADYYNYSSADDSYHETKLSLVYSKRKMVSLTGVYRNHTKELLSTLTVEYLPEKTVTHSLVWFKQSNSVRVKLELVPKVPLTWETSWRSEDGISIESSVEFLNKKIENWFTYSRTTGEYNGHFEICPAYPLIVRGLLMRENGLLFTTEIGAFNRTWNHKIDFRKDEQKLQVSFDVLPNIPVGFDAGWDTSEGMQIALDLKGFKKSLHLVSSYDSLTKTFKSSVTVFQKTFTFIEKLDIETKTLHLTIAAFNRTFGFIGRFDWKNYVASTFLSYQNNEVGWFLSFNPATRSIIFNITLTPMISGQVVGEMSDEHRLQVTLQRKFGVDVVNESRLIYLLNAEASRVSLTWNTTTVNTLVGKVQNLGSLLTNVTLKYYNLTVNKAKNLTKELDAMVKKLEAKIRPHILKLYAQVEKYNCSGLLQNVTKMAQNLTQRLNNITLKAYNYTMKHLPNVMRNITTLYKQLVGNTTELFKSIRLNVTEACKQFRTEVLPLILGNITQHLNKIGRDLNVWASNVSVMVSAVAVRGQNLGDIAKRLPRKVKEITAELVKKVELKTRELIVKIREIEIREQKIGPLFDKYILKVREFTCGFNVSCTVKNLTIIAMNLPLAVRNTTVLNKTIEEHFKLLNQTVQLQFKRLNTTLRKQLKKLHTKACLIHQTAVNFTRNLTRIFPKLMRNVTIQAIKLAGNIGKEVITIAIKVRKVTITTYAKLLKTHRPLVNLTTKAFNSLKGKAYLVVLKVLQPISQFAALLNNNLTRYLKPIAKPLVPMVLDIVYQLRNISVRHVTIGHAMDRAVIYSLEFTSQALKSINHTLRSNISAAIAFIRDNSQKSHEEIVDFAITKSIQFYNLTKKVLNQSLHFNMSRHASLVYYRSITAFNKTLQELLNLRPNEIVNITIKSIQVIGKSITAEILNVTQQLRDLAVIRPVKSAWEEIDLKGKIGGLKFKEKWNSLVQSIRAFNLKERALLFKYHVGNATLKVQKELQIIFNLSQRILNLTSHLVRMNISKEAFVEEFIAIGNETGRVFIKYGILAKNTTFDWQRQLLNVSLEKAAFYKKLTVNKTIEVYNLLKKHGQAFFIEHRDDARAVYKLYKDMTREMYNELKEKALERVHVYREKLNNQVQVLVEKLRQYENMTYEEIAIKAYEFSRKHGLAVYNNVTVRAMQLYKNVTIPVVNLYKNVTTRGLEVYKNISLRAINLYKNISLRAISLYKNVTIRAIKLYKNISTRGIQLYRNVTLKALKLFNDTKNATMRAYNFSMVLIKRSTFLAIKYLNATRNLTIHYYNVTRNYTLQYYNLTRSLALQYYLKYYNLSRIYALHMYNVTHNMTLRGFNKTQELILRGVRYLGYLNKIILPKIKESFLEGKVLVIRYVNKTLLFVKGSVHSVKVWYQENKEKSLEELYYEAYELAELKSIEAKEILERKYFETKERLQEKIKDRLDVIKSKLNAKVEEWKKVLQTLNNTLINITGEAIFVYNKTADITYFAAKELAAIFNPYVTFVHNKTVFYLVRAKAISLPLLDKVMNISLLNLNETTKLVNETYLAFMAREDVQELIKEYQLKERYAEAETFVLEKYNEVAEYVEERRHKVEAKIQTAIDYVNVTLPARIKERFVSIKERYNMIQKKYERIMANPRVFIDRVLKKVLRYLRNTTKETPFEKYLYQETWVELFEEAKGHQLVEVGRNITNLTSDNLRMAAELASKNVKLLVEKIKNHTELLKEQLKAKVQESREQLIEKFEDFKTVKLREIVEHKYVFKAIELAKNITLQVQNVTLQARNLTQKIVAIGKVYYKNIIAKVQNYTLLVKEKFNNYTKMLRQRVLNYTRILNETLRNYTGILNETVQNYTKIVKAKVQNYTSFLNATVQNYTRILNASLQNYAKILNASVQNYRKVLLAKVQNYTKMIKAQFQNYTLILRGHYDRIYESHFLPLYRNGTILVHKYKAIAEHCIGRCRNVTLTAISLASSWTMAKVNLTSVWLNQTIQKGIKYYEDELKPLYYSKVLPFYNNTLVPMYHNYSKLVIIMRRNLSLQAINMKEQAINIKERAINLTRQVVKITLDSHPYAMLRKVGKMTIRESVHKGRKMYIQALNYTLNMTRTIVNVTLTRFNSTKDFLERMINKTMLAVNTTVLEAETVFAFLNATREEVIQASIFLYKYSGLEDAVTERVQRSIDFTRNATKSLINIAKNTTKSVINIARNTTKSFINIARNATYSLIRKRAPMLFKLSARKALTLVNTTIQYANRYLNRAIVYLNATFINSTIQYAKGYLNRTIVYFNATFINSTVQYANMYLNGSLVYFNATFINSTIQNAKGYLNRAVVYLNATFINATRGLNLTIYNIRIPINQTIDKIVQVARIALNKTIKIVQAVRVAVNRTISEAHIPINQTIAKIVQVGRIAFNKTTRVVQAARVAVNRTINEARIFVQKAGVVINDTIEKTRVSLENALFTINETITGFRAAIPKYIQVTEGGITLVIPHPRPFNGNIKALAIASVERIKNLPQEVMQKIEALKQELIYKIRSLKRVVVTKIKSLKIKFKELKVQALDKIKSLKEEALEKMEVFKRESMIKMKSLKSVALIKMESLKQNAIEKFGELKVKAKNLTGRVKTIGKAWVAVAMNRTVMYRQKAYGFIVEAYKLTRNHPITRTYINVTLHYINITKDMAVFYRQNGYAIVLNTYNLTKNHPLTRRYLNTTLHYFNITKRLAVKYYNKTVKLARKYYNLTKNHPVIVKCTNMTVRYFNITKKYLLRAINMSRQYLNMTQIKNVSYRYLSHALNLSRRYVFFNQVRDIAYKFLNMTRQSPVFKQMRAVSYQFLNLTRRCTFLRQPKNVTMKYLYRALNLSRQCLNMTEQYLYQALNLSRHWYGIAVNKTVNYSMQVYKLAENVTVDIYNSGSLAEAFEKTRNYSKMAFNITIKLYSNYPAIAINKTLALYSNYSTVALTRTLRLYRNVLARARNLSALAVNKTIKLYTHMYNRTLVVVYNTTLVKQYLPMVKTYVPIALNATRNFTIQAYKVMVDVTLDIYNSSCLEEAFDKTRNYSSTAVNVTMKLYRVVLVQAKNFSTIALNKTIKLYRHVYNRTLVIINNTTLVKQYLPMVKTFVPIALNATRNFTIQAYKVVVNFTLDIYNSSCLGEAFGKARNYSSIAVNMTMKFYRVAKNFSAIAVNKTVALYKNYSSIALNKTLAMYREVLGQVKNFSAIALDKTVALYKNYSTIGLNKTMSLYREALVKCRNFSSIVLNKFNKTIKLCRRLYNKTMGIVYNTTLVKKYLPVVQTYAAIVINTTRNFTVRAYKITVNVSLDIYNSSCLMEAYNKTRNYSKIAFNTTVRLCEVVSIKARNYSTIAFNKTLAFCKNYSTIALNKTLQLYRDALVKGKNYSSIAFNKTLKFYQSVYNKTVLVLYNSTLAKKYLPMMFNVSRHWCSLGYNVTRNFTVQIYKYAVNVTLDLCQSKNVTQAVMKFRNYSANIFNQTVRFCHELYNSAYNATLQRYNELCSKSLALYKEIAYHEITVKCIKKARNYIDHTKRMVKMRVRNFNRAKGHLQKRINHEINQMSLILNPVNWIPPFNSTAMIFGGPHVYTFDGTYYEFPGYKKPGCMYVLARDVRDNKVTILSQETAIIVVTEDSSVKIHQDGRVETIVKITSSGKKISDGYHSELPVETFNTTVSREGSFILFRHDLGLEIVCDVEHYLCTFNMARWYHGRMAGLLGTNNNEHHDEFMTSSNKQTKVLTDFVNSWEVTRDPECKILPTDKVRPKCKESSYVQRCRSLFKDTKSPLHRFASVVNPEPFVKACERDYKECESSTPKDMKHCNTTAAYIELARMRGEYADYLPECGRCGDKEIGQRWFQRADKMVDVVVLVHETSVLKSYAEKLPTFLNSITEALDQSKYSFKFGVMAYGGRLLHARPHAITLDGQLMNDLDSVWTAFEHLKFAGEQSENDTSDALEAMTRAAYLYPFRPAATKIFLLLTSTERGAFVDAISVDSVSKLLETKDITLNVIGKYRKFRGEIVGQDYRGKVFYRKKPEIGTGVAPLPDGEYMALMKGTQGSVFGLPFLGSENKDKFGALQQASVSTWREQIKRDQFTCKECFCARGDAGQGKTICKVNSLHQKC